MNCIIVDDDKMARLALRQLVSQLDFLTLIAECENPIQAINILKKGNIDLVLLDVEMPDMNGLDFLKIEGHPLIILITSARDYAVEAFEHNVVDYIVKPIKKERFVIAINRALELYKNQGKIIDNTGQEFITIRDKSILTKINIADILFFQALGDYVTIHTTHKKYTIRLMLKTVEEKLSSLKFIRIHRSYIIAIDKVESLEENTITINKNLIPVSDMYRSEFIKKLNLL